MKGAPYSVEDRRIMRRWIHSSEPLEVLLEQLNRPKSGVMNKFVKLVQNNKITWGNRKVLKAIREWRGDLWRSALTDEKYVAECREEVADFYRENPNASTSDLYAEGLAYALYIGFNRNTGKAKLYANIGQNGEREDKETKEKRLVAYVKKHPQATKMPTPSMRRAQKELGFDIHELRKRAGLVPKEYRLSARIATIMGVEREWISQHYRAGELKGKKVGRNVYLDPRSVEECFDIELPSLSA